MAEKVDSTEEITGDTEINNVDLQDGETGQAQSAKSRIPGVKFSLKIKFALAIIFLVAIIIITMTIYIINEESEVLKNEMFKFARREIEHLHNSAVDAISSESELQLAEVVINLKKLESIKYVYVLNSDNIIIQNFDLKRNGTILEDDIIKKVNKMGIADETMINTLSESDSGGQIFDFAKPVFHKVFKERRVGSVRLGFSDKVIREKIAGVTFNIMVIALIFLGLAVVGAIVLATITINPIKKLSEGATVIGTGNLDYKIDLKTSDEIGRLAYEFNIMTDQLKKAKDLEIESRIMEEQLELAKEIQEGLNPMGYYDKGGIQIKGFTRAAKGVGGDYFDYVDIDDDRVGALLSDVSGKGVPASLVMVMIRTVFVSYISRKDIQCASVVNAINDSLSADFAIDKFATLFFVIYKRSAGELHFTNAGHGPLFCYRSSLNACTVSKLEGVPIGIMDEVEYNQAKIKLNPGDIILIYSDGVTEMRNENKEEYGRQRLQEMVVKNNELNAKELVEKIVNDVDTFRGEVSPHDDMTLLVMKRTG